MPEPRLRREAAATLGLAGPVIVAQLAAVGMGIIDTVYAGRVGPQALTAVAVAVNVATLFLVLFMGLFMACSPIVAQLRGSGATPEVVGAFMVRSRRLAVPAGLAWVGGLNLVGPPVLRALGLAPQTTAAAVEFLRWFSWTGLATTVWFALRFVAEGMGATRPVMRAGLWGLAANIALGWLLVFGHLGAPRLGINGLALASTLATVIRVVVLTASYRRTPGLREAAAAARAIGVRAIGAHPPGDGARAVLRLGLPIAAAIVAENGLFVVVGVLMARFGESTAAAYQVAFTVLSLAFMIPLGIGAATCVRVGHAAGAGSREAVRHRGSVGIALGAVAAVSNAAALLLLAPQIARVFTDDPGIRAQAVDFLRLAGVFQLFDGLQGATAGALRGVKDTRIPMWVTLGSYWALGLPLGSWLAFGSGHGPVGLWWGLTVGLAAAAVGLGRRFAVLSAPGAVTATPTPPQRMPT